MTFLEKILESRRRSVEAECADPATLQSRVSSALPPRDFAAAVRAPGMSLIAEFKRASPSRGVLNEGLDPAVQARCYEAGGAAALSVLTEPEFFKGSAADLAAAREATQLPVLWKDFVIDPRQVLLARAWYADAVLLIVRILSDEMLGLLMHETHRLGMAALVEVFDEKDLARAADAGASIVGVNHRDLETFEEDPDATVRLRPLVPAGVAVVGESAISSRRDVEALESAGVDAVLVGEALVRAEDAAARVRELLGRS
ncbi:MAG TPA: indole-3-glycerol phosphate synthase TrpC [Actinomycetota bacterium]|nr:indole-3-glycerol phosphate synthase TrpC [Actinomycetota bacterium]